MPNVRAETGKGGVSMCHVIQMRSKSKPKVQLAERKLMELWRKIGIASLILQDGRQVEVHDGRFVVTLAGPMPRPLQSRSRKSGRVNVRLVSNSGIHRQPVPIKVAE
jgi:hypothetical protein